MTREETNEIYENDVECECGTRFCEKYICCYGDDVPYYIPPYVRCVNCGGIITNGQRKERRKKIERQLKLLKS